MEKKWGPSPAVVDVPATVTGRQGAVLQILRADDRDDGDGLKVVDVAEKLHLHVNTAREHLDALVDGGLAVRVRAESSGRGRPAWLYRLAEGDADERFGAYRGMALVLAGHLSQTADDARADARDLGRAWGRRLASDAEPDPRHRVIADLGRVGFAPVAEADDTYALTRCPLLDAAREYPEVTCQLHLGLIRGLLGDDAAVGDPILIPFARRGSCTLRLPSAPQR